MTDNPMEVIQRGVDSSGRPLKFTKQHWQFIDRLNAGPAKGLLVPIQGGFRRGQGADASGDTHDLAKCGDFRRWNLSDIIAHAVKVEGRRMGGSMWERTEAQGFDPHFHNLLYGDTPGSPGANAQEYAWVKLGRNGLGANYAQYPDDFWRPNPILPYEYIPEDDMFEQSDRETINAMAKDVEAMRAGSYKRDMEIKRKISDVITLIGKQADSLTLAINAVDDEGIKKQLRQNKRQILQTLKDLDFVDGKDNPSDDAMKNN